MPGSSGRSRSGWGRSRCWSAASTSRAPRAIAWCRAPSSSSPRSSWATWRCPRSRSRCSTRKGTRERWRRRRGRSLSRLSDWTRAATFGRSRGRSTSRSGCSRCCRGWPPFSGSRRSCSGCGGGGAGWRRTASSRRPSRPRPPHEIAYEAFRALEAERLPDRGEIKTFHIRASDVVRTYVEGRFGVDALELTTGEVLDGLRGNEVDEDLLDDFRRLLQRCDLVKFAKDRPALERCRDVIPLGRSLVDRTRVVVPPAESATDTEPAAAEAGTA